LNLNPQPPEATDVLSDIQGAKVKEQYEAWAKQQDAAGGDSNIVIPMGRSRNHAKEGRVASGTAVIDFKNGHVKATAGGLVEGKEYDLWLLDNVDGKGRSSMPETDDKMIRVGSFVPDGEFSKVESTLPAGTFESFQPDMAIVSLRNETPVTSQAMLGSLSLFQRMYTALGSPNRLLASDFSDAIRRGPAPEGESILQVRSAYAVNVFIDADVVFKTLVRTGADLFLNGTFSGNGRTCGTCHPGNNNVTIDVPFIATLTDDNPLFAAEFMPALANNFENPLLMRKVALIKENLDGFDNLAQKFVMRSVPHTLALKTSLAPTSFPFDNSVPANSNFPPGYPAQRTGWGGDGAPNGGSLRDFATGAVTQHFPLTLGRVPGVDFVLPTPAQLDAMEAFQLALGRQAEVNITTLKIRDAKAKLGREIFNRLDTGNPPKPSIGLAPNPFPQGPALPAGKCALCHENAGATLNVVAFTQLFNNLGVPLPTLTGNANFATGVNDLAALPADIYDRAGNRRDGGFGVVPHDGVTPLPQNGNQPCANGRGGFGVVTLPGGVLPPGLCEEDFNTPPLIEAADTPPFFHNNAVNTIEAAAAFYNDDAFNNSVGGQLLKALDTNGVGVKLDTTQISAIAAFLRVLNALENIRQSRELLDGITVGLVTIGSADLDQLFNTMRAEVEDAITVLQEGHLHPAAVGKLKAAANILATPARLFQIGSLGNRLNEAKADIVDP
jgi:cytochrome c peroxidase